MSSEKRNEVAEEELTNVVGGLITGGFRKGRTKVCPLCGSSNVESYHMGSGWSQRRYGRCKDCSYEGGWGNFI